MFYEQRTRDCLEREPELMPAVVESLKEFGMPGAYLLGDYEERRAAMEQAAFPTLAAKKDAFVRIFAKMTRVVGEDNAMRVFTEGNYLSDGQPDPVAQEDAPGDDHAADLAKAGLRLTLARPPHPHPTPPPAWGALKRVWQRSAR